MMTGMDRKVGVQEEGKKERKKEEVMNDRSEQAQVRSRT